MKRIKHYDMVLDGKKVKGVYALKPEYYKGYKILFRGGSGPNRGWVDANVRLGKKLMHFTAGRTKSTASKKARVWINKRLKGLVQPDKRRVWKRKK